MFVPILISLYLNDTEEQFMNSGIEGIDIDMFKLFLLLYTDGIVIFANNPEKLQNGLDLLYDFCSKWKLTININKTKIMMNMIFSKHTHKKSVQVIISR